jgi:hypothetical protein
LLQYFPKHRAILVQKLGEEKEVVKIRFRLFSDLKKERKKFRWPLSSRGVKALMAMPLVEDLFFAASLRNFTMQIRTK